MPARGFEVQGERFYSMARSASDGRTDIQPWERSTFSCIDCKRPPRRSDQEGKRFAEPVSLSSAKDVVFRLGLAAFSYNPHPWFLSTSGDLSGHPHGSFRRVARRGFTYLRSVLGAESFYVTPMATVQTGHLPRRRAYAAPWSLRGSRAGVELVDLPARSEP